MGILVESPVKIEQVEHITGIHLWSAFPAGEFLNDADDTYAIFGSPERECYIDAIYVRVSACTGTMAGTFYKAPAGTAMVVAGTGSTAVTSTIDMVALTDNTWTAATMVTTGGVLKLAQGDMLFLSLDMTTAGDIDDLCVYIRYHTELTG